MNHQWIDEFQGGLVSQMENEQGPAGEPNHIRSLLDGESGSVEILWKTYFARIRSLISNRIRNSPKLAGYEEDIALSAFGSFVRRAAEGQFPDLRDDDELWKLLKTFAIRKTNDHFKYHMAEKRGGKVWTTQHSAVGEDGESVDSFQPIDPSCSPEASVDVSDLFNFVLSALPDDFCLDIVLLKLQGASIAAIAEMLQCSTRTVQRKLKDIESIWTELT